MEQKERILQKFKEVALVHRTPLQNLIREVITWKNMWCEIEDQESIYEPQILQSLQRSLRLNILLLKNN